MAKDKPIKMHFPISYVRDYLHKYVEHIKKESDKEPEKAIWDDIQMMVDIAFANMKQVPPKNLS